MATKKTTQSSSTQTTSALSLTPLHQRLQTLHADHQWLLKQIRRKRTELDNFMAEMRDLISKIYTRGAAIHRKLQEVDNSIHQLFQEILANKSKKKLSKKQLVNIEKLYHSLQMEGIISSRSLKAEFMASNMPESPEEESATSSELPQTSPSSDNDRPDPHLRQTFLRLASLYHPDRATDNETQSQNTEIMKEINRAYQEGDFARLLELERMQQNDEPMESLDSEDDLERQCQRLTRENDVLRQQYAGIKDELRTLRNRTHEGLMVKTYRSASKEGLDFIAIMLEEIETEIVALEGIKDFVSRFYKGEISLQQFISGPSRKISLEDMLEIIVVDSPKRSRRR